MLLIMFREYVETVLLEKDFNSPALQGIMRFHFKTITFIFQVESLIIMLSIHSVHGCLFLRIISPGRGGGSDLRDKL